MDKLRKRNLFKNTSLLGGIIVFIIICFANISPQHMPIRYTLAVALLMTIWWVTEAVSISVTALLPIVLFPIFGVMKGSAVATTYFNNIIFLFIGGFLIAKAMEIHNLHKRIALKILLVIGISYGRVLLGFMFATFFLSGWMSITATAMMMIPVVISAISKFGDYLDNADLRKI